MSRTSDRALMDSIIGMVDRKRSQLMDQYDALLQRGDEEGTRDSRTRLSGAINELSSLNKHFREAKSSTDVIV